MAYRLITTLLLLTPFATQAQIADPTRPAIDVGQAAPSGAVAPNGATGLQSIIQRRNGKPAALINGSVVELGGKVGDARLVKIGDDFVVLRGALGDETLRLTPAVERQAAKGGKNPGSAALKEKK